MASYLAPIQVSVRTGIAKTTLAKWRKDSRGPIFVKRRARIGWSPFSGWATNWTESRLSRTVGVRH